MTLTIRLPFRIPKFRFPSLTVPRVRRETRLLAGQLAGAAGVLAGIGLYSVPCMLIVGGLAAIVAIERQP